MSIIGIIGITLVVLAFVSMTLIPPFSTSIELDDTVYEIGSMLLGIGIVLSFVFIMYRMTIFESNCSTDKYTKEEHYVSKKNTSLEYDLSKYILSYKTIELEDKIDTICILTPKETKSKCKHVHNDDDDDFNSVLGMAGIMSW